MSAPVIDPNKPKDWRNMIISGPPISMVKLHKKLSEARPRTTSLERKRDKLMNRILRQQAARLETNEHD